MSEVFGFDFPTWTVGVNVSYAIPNRSAKANAASAQINKDQALTSFRRLELQVAAEVRTAARGVESGFKRVSRRRRPACWPPSGSTPRRRSSRPA